MIIKTIAVLALAGVVSSGAVYGATTLTQWGAVTSIANAACATDFCGDDTDTNFFATLAVTPISGGVGQTMAGAASGAWPIPASALANATVASGLSTPLLTAGAASDPNAWIAGQALVVQGYQYSGPGETLNLNWNLSGNIANPDSDPITGLVVFVGFFPSTSLVFPPVDADFPLNAFTLLTSLALASPADNFMQFTAPGAVNVPGTVNFDVQDGDEIYLVMGLMAAAGGSGASASSLTTLTSSFAGSPALSPAFTLVPVPAALPLMLCALACLGFVGRHCATCGRAAT